VDYCGFMWYRYRYVSRDHTANMEVSAAPGACSRVRQFVPKHQMLSVSTDLVHLPTFLPTDPPTCTRRFVRPVTNSSIAPSVHPSTQIYARAHTHRDTLHMRPCTNACVNPFPRADQPFDLVSVIHTHTHILAGFNTWILDILAPESGRSLWIMSGTSLLSNHCPVVRGWQLWDIVVCQSQWGVFFGRQTSRTHLGHWRFGLRCCCGLPEHDFTCNYKAAVHWSLQVRDSQGCAYLGMIIRPPLHARQTPQWWRLVSSWAAPAERFQQHGSTLVVSHGLRAQNGTN